jgi:hypothetical protein
MNRLDERLNGVWLALRLGLGAAAFLAGLDKFFNILTDWTAYLSPLATAFLPIGATTFMKAVGVIEMIVGVTILTKWTRLGSYVASIWLLCIALNLVTTGKYFDVAVRDVIMSISAFALARLTEVRETNGKLAEGEIEAQPVRLRAASL